MEAVEAKLKAQHENKEKIERPAHWGGWRLVPSMLEFWKRRESQLHDRIVYTRDNEDGDLWTKSRLQP